MDEGHRREELAVHVRRTQVFEDSFRELHRRTPDEWKNRFYIVFEGKFIYLVFNTAFPEPVVSSLSKGILQQFQMMYSGKCFKSYLKNMHLYKNKNYV